MRHLEAVEEGVRGEGTHPILPVISLVALQRLDDAFHLRDAREEGGEGGRDGRIAVRTAREESSFLIDIGS